MKELRFEVGIAYNNVSKEKENNPLTEEHKQALNNLVQMLANRPGAVEVLTEIQSRTIKPDIKVKPIKFDARESASY